jgi:hypothetical protein
VEKEVEMVAPEEMVGDQEPIALETKGTAPASGNTHILRLGPGGTKLWARLEKRKSTEN